MRVCLLNLLWQGAESFRPSGQRNQSVPCLQKQSDDADSALNNETFTPLRITPTSTVVIYYHILGRFLDFFCGVGGSLYPRWYRLSKKLLTLLR